MYDAYLHSFMIAKILGLWFVIISFTMIGKRQYIRTIVDAFDQEKLAHFTFASMLTFLGIVLICFHNYWVWNKLLVVTVACWLILIKGVFWLAFPEWMVRVSKASTNSGWYWVGAIILLIYGILLLSYGTYYLKLDEFYHLNLMHMPK